MHLPLPLRPFAIALAGAILSAPVFAAEGPLPWTLRIEVVWGAEANREIYREQLESLLVEDLSARSCYRAVRTDPPGDLTLRATVDHLDVAEDMEFRGPPTGGSGEYVSLGVTITIEGRLDLLAPDGTAIRETRHFRRVARADPRTPTDQPLTRGILEALNEPVRWAERLACGKPEKLVEEAAKAGLHPAAAAQP